MGHWEGREGQDVRRGIRQQLGHLGKGLPELFHHSVQLAVDLGRRQLLARWTARIGLGEQLVTTKTLRRRFFSLAGRLTRSARRLTLHLPPALALGKPVQSRLGSIASPSTPSLTAAVCH